MVSRLLIACVGKGCKESYLYNSLNKIIRKKVFSAVIRKTNQINSYFIKFYSVKNI